MPLELLGLIGAECTGKSTLARALQRDLSAVVVPESLREFVEIHGRTPRPEEQFGLLTAQRQAVADACATAGSDAVVIADPVPAMTAVYSLAYFGDGSLLADACADLSRFRLVVWCRPDFTWVPDGLHRDGDDMRLVVDELIANQILPHASVRVVEARGPVHERARVVEQAWLRSLAEDPT